MGFLSGLKSLFASTTDPVAADPVEYNGFIITPAPMPEGRQYRVAATITKGEGESTKTHTFIRSDVVGNRDECIEITIRKAQRAIDQSGEHIFN